MPQIAKALDVDQATVSRVIDKVMQNRTTAETHKPLPELPDLFAGTEDDGEPEPPPLAMVLKGQNVPT